MSLSLSPQNINDRTWYYEDKKGIEVYHEVYDGDRFIKTVSVTVPWSKIRRSLKRKDHKKLTKST